MLISLRSDHKEHLNLLTSQSTQVIIDFCKLAIDFLHNGPNIKLYTTAAEKLSVDVSAVKNCIYGLVNLLLIGCKYQLSDADFRDSVLTIGFTTEQQVVLSKYYESKKDEISQFITKLALSEPHYDNLEWRFEIQVASRSLHSQVTPQISLELQLKTLSEDGFTYNKEKKLLQTDIINLVHITEELERALTESKSRHSRKIQKSLNSSEIRQN